MRYLVIENGVATNAIEAESEDALPDTLLVRSDTGQIGQLWDGVQLQPAPPPQVSAQALRKYFEGEIQAYLDAKAAERSYGDERTSPIVSACSYASSSHPRFGPEGRACLAWREAVWDAAFAILADVEAGNRPVPAGFEEIRDELPTLTWPDEGGGA